jgi:hypothetical protein
LKALFPATAKCYVDSYVKPGNPKRHEPDQTILRGGYTLKTGHLESLNGPSATLFEDGSLSGLAYYKSSLRHGKLLVWDKENRPLYYGEYVRGKKMGLVCLFVDGHPALIQECNSGEVTAQYLVAFNKSAPVAVPEDRLTPRQTAEFKTAADKLALFESDIDEGEKKVKACVAAWVKQNTVAMAHERYDASARRSAARHAADDAAMGEMWQGAMRRSGM